MKRKITALLLCALMVSAMGLSGCSSSSSSGSASTASTTSASSSSTTTELTRTDYDFHDYITLGNYIGVEVTETAVNITDDEVDAEIQSELSSSTTYTEVTDRTTVENGDFVVMDYSGYLDGTQFSGGTGSTTETSPLEIGSGSFVGNFEEQLIGKEVGVEYTLTGIEFPSTYSSTELAGKSTDFVITVNKILKKNTVEMTDEYIAANTAYTSLESMREAVRASLESDAQEDLESQTIYDVWMAIAANSKYTLPDGAVLYYYNNLVNTYSSYASYYGVDLATYVQYVTGMSETNFYAYAQQYAENSVLGDLLYQAIAEDANITISDDEYTTGLNEYATEYSMTASDFETQYGKDVIKDSLLYDKVVNHVVSNAKVTYQ